MASPATQDHWPDLSGLGLTDARNPDARAALLTVNAEMFVAAPTRDREIIETFETLALGFLPRMDHDTLVTVARILAPCEDTPASILDHLVRHSPETRDIVLGQTAYLPSTLVIKLLGTEEGRLRLAFHPSLDPATIDNLLVLHESAVEDALAANRCIAPTSPALKELVRRARDRLPLGAILLARENLTLADEAALYLAADAQRRVRIQDRIASSTGIQRATLPFNLTEHEIAAFFAASKAGDIRHLEALLTYALGFPASADWRILATGRHHLLPLALKALGFIEKEAMRIFLTLHPALNHSLSYVTSLTRVVRDVPSPVALALVEAILGVQSERR
ncbi:hypothetical protein [Microvirga sp. 2TAF3]|uniref:hypothetical protein n=1 Tax=Microvirga sp. 2TAF3 TaxID=3233014 RepID=UPI003F976632